MDNVVQLRAVPDDSADHLAGAMTEAAAEAVAILDDVAGQLQLLTANLRFLATCTESHASSVLLATMAFDIDMLRHAVPSAVTEAVTATPPRGA